MFGKKQNERMQMKKVQDYVIEIKKGFVPRKRKVYLLSREEKNEVCKLIQEQ